MQYSHMVFSIVLAAYRLIFNKLESIDLLLVGFCLLLVALFLLLCWLLLYKDGTLRLFIVKIDTQRYSMIGYDTQ
jgi:hypothetical protein